ncbi:unnamed protein product [Blepharisma stoltei]|uniref:Uncharacterized protein n=1 Tax=Blepharisma stoltei TaxID=1481888 RepID=A0AAU9K3A5_9CILI|nr:unnamed protein product [Blepharisma stoltei]
MKLLDKFFRKWYSLPASTRVNTKETGKWIFLYLIFLPGTLLYMINGVYDIQEESWKKRAVPEELSDESFNRWLKKQHEEGRFLDEKFK